MRKLLFVALLLSAVILPTQITRAADARCCNKQEDNCTFNCTYSCRFKTPQAPCDTTKEEEADCLGQAWHNLNAGVACAEMIKGIQSETDATEQEKVFSEIKPKLQIPIGPNFQFSALLKQDVEEGDATATYLYIPYLAEYFSMLYKYLIGIAGVLAGIMIVIAGFEWLVAAGDASKIKHAKSRISNAVIGLILALGSYTILYLVNPDLVAFKALKIPYVRYEETETVDDPEESLAGTPIGAQQSIESGSFASRGPGNCNAQSILDAGNYFKFLNMCNGADHCVWGVGKVLYRAGCFNESKIQLGLSSFAAFATKPENGWRERSLGESPLRKRTSSSAVVSSLLQDNEFVVARKFGLPRGAHHMIIAKVAGTTYCIESNWLSDKKVAAAMGAPGCYKANLTQIKKDMRASGATNAAIAAAFAATCQLCTKIDNHGGGFGPGGSPSTDPAVQYFKVWTGRFCEGRVATAILCPPNLPGPCTRP